MYKAYCVKCKTKTIISNPEKTEMKGSRGVRKAVKGTCIECGTTVYAILKNDGN